MGISLILYMIFNVILGIAIFVYYVTNFKEVNSYFKYGAFIVGIIFIIQLLSGQIGINIIVYIISYLKTIIYVCIGIHLCSKLGRVDIPLIKRLFEKVEGERINVKSYIISTTAVILGSVIFSYVLFKITSPSISETMKNVLINSSATGEISAAPTVQSILAISAIAISEEIGFRFVIQNYLAKIFKLDGKKYWIAIIFSAFFWTLAHGNTLNPEWVKFAQIFPIGIALGGLYKKYGLESSIFAHVGFNLILGFFSQQLIRM